MQEELENMKREIEKNEPYEKLLREVSKMKKNWQPTLFEDLFKVYYMNMERSVERKEHIEEHFRKFKIPIERIGGVDGKDIYSDAFVKEYFSYRKNKTQDIFFPHHPNPSQAGYKGVILSMMKGIHTFLTKDDRPYLLLLEDDAEFIVENPKETLVELARNNTLAEVNFIETRAQNSKCCLAGVIYKREAAKIVLNNFNPLNPYFKYFDKITLEYEESGNGWPALADFMLQWMCDFQMVTCFKTPIMQPQEELSCNSTINHDGKGDYCKKGDK